MRTGLDTTTVRSIYDRVAGRYDLLHALLTARADQRGREMLVEAAIGEGMRVLDCGAGTGSTALLAARKVGPAGRVTLFDLSDRMLEVARRRLAAAALEERCDLRRGDILELPFADETFDSVLSTYSLCPVSDPAQGARELYRVTRAGGLIGVAHSTAPRAAPLRWLAERVEGVAWRLPCISLGCRSVEVLPALVEAGARVLWERRIGVALWPFLVFVVAKEAGQARGAPRAER